MTKIQNSQLHRYPCICIAEWCGIEIEVTHSQNWHGCIDHIEIRTKDRIALPITETGYKSQFIPQDHLNGYDDAVAYVLAWLDHKAKNREWRELQDQRRQLSLFWIYLNSISNTYISDKNHSHSSIKYRYMNIFLDKTVIIEHSKNIYAIFVSAHCLLPDFHPKQKGWRSYVHFINLF